MTSSVREQETNQSAPVNRAGNGGAAGYTRIGSCFAWCAVNRALFGDASTIDPY